MALVALAIPFLCTSSADAGPDSIRPGASYYSDESVQNGLIRDIDEEKNFEEVYQNYTYYEATYDERERVAVFIEYKRGQVLQREEYTYRPDGVLLTRTSKRPGKSPEVTHAPSASGKER
ncbi:MAG: hypothetical protein GY725_03270 [bacterium]|nr:hypothetical protein [bacterium]